ncbi:MAG: glycosyltransferase family 4 protein [Bacteroidales bacterium]|nr:glycosyltransferase family 4 protein [Bacteroidales bacterium]
MNKSTPDRLHILYLPKWYPHKYDPMSGLFIERHGISALPHCDISVLYVHADDKQKKPIYQMMISDNETLNTIRIYYKRAGTGIKPLDMMINTCRFVRSHLKGIREIRKRYGKFDIIHVHVLTRHAVIALREKIRRGIPFVITEHWTRYLPSTNTFNGAFRKWMTRIVAKQASAIMPVTANLRDAMIDCGLKNNNYIVIPNVVDIKMFSPDPDKKPGDKAKIIHVSCFDDQQKNISGITRVIKRLSEKRQDFTVDMVGEGIHYEELLEYGDEMGVKNTYATYFGLKENEELAALMKAADFMIMFSRYENLPVVILESYACGVPVISTDVGGIREHMNKDLGILLDSEDEEAFYNILDNMLDNYRDYNAKKIREYAVSHFSNEVIGKQLSEVYKAVTKL